MSKSLSLSIPARHPAQRQVVDEAARFNVLACGRRWGKSWLGVDLLIDAAVQGKPVAWFSPTYRMLSDAWRMVREVVQPVTVAARADEHRIELMSGGTVDMFSLDNPDTSRGRKFAKVIIDEAAMSPNLEPAWTNVIRPTLADLRGGAWFMSTPRGHNYFWQLYNLGIDRAEGWRSWRKPTATNPYIGADEIEAARRTLPERVFAQEFLAEFIEDGGAVFRGVYKCANGTPMEPQADHAYVMGVDLARLADFSVIAVLDTSVDPIALVHLDRFNKIDWTFQVGKVRAIAERYHVSMIQVDATGLGDPVIELLRSELGRVVHFEISD